MNYLPRALLFALPLLFAAIAPNANARDHHRGYNGHFGGYSAGYYGRSNHRRSHHRRSHYGRYRRGHHYGYRNRSRHGREGAYLIGGLVVGSLITHAIHRDRTYDHRYEDQHSQRRTGSTRGVSDNTPVSRHLFRDAQGNCFERQTSDAGEELLIELPQQDCRW